MSAHDDQGRFIKGHHSAGLDLIGQRFGRLLVTGRAEPYLVRTRGYMRAMWACRCDCGSETRVATGALRGSGGKPGTQSCGCAQKEKAAATASARTGVPSSQLIDLAGLRVGHLTVISKAGRTRTKAGKATDISWNVVCDCGRTKTARGADLRNSKSVSCGKGECRTGTKPSGMGMARAIYAAYRCRARGRNDRPTPLRVFEITFEQFLMLTTQPCTYCGNQPETTAWNGKANGAFVYNGLDRVDNERGYTLENVVPCCGLCNLMKRGLSVSDFIRQCRRIADHVVPVGI